MYSNQLMKWQLILNVMYDKYFNILGTHITERFPDANLLEGFEILKPC